MKSQEMSFEPLKEHMKSTTDNLLKAKTTYVISREKYESVIRHLTTGDNVTPHFKAWVKKKRFSIQNIPALDIVDTLVVPADEKEDPLRLGNFKRVIPADEMFDVVRQVHCTELQHAGYKKTLEKVQRMFNGIPRSYVQEFCKNCPVCQLSVPQTVRPPLRPIIATGFLNRVQVDLIDMRHDPDGDFKWIGHFMDHFSKYHVIFPLKQKTAQEVADKLQERVLSYLGVPKIFHSDNGREFVNELLHALFDQWGGDVLFVRGRPRHSQSQGLVENGNKTLESRLAAMKAEKSIGENTPWVSWLPRIQYGLNVTVQESIKETPYAVVFGQQPQSSFVPGSTVNFVDEEDIDGCVEPPEKRMRPIPSPRKMKDAPVPPPVPAPRRKRDTTSPQSPSPSHATTPDDQSQSSSHATTPADQSPSQDEIKQLSFKKYRDKAMTNYKANAERMKETFRNRKRIRVIEFENGDMVTVDIPKLDRSCSNPRRLPAIIYKVTGDTAKRYHIATEFGTLKGTFQGGDLMPYTGDMTPNYKQETTLREASRKAYPKKLQTKRCGCTSRCTTARCPCKRQGEDCTSHCHPSHACSNRTKTTTATTTKHQMLIVGPKNWLTDRHMDEASQLMKKIDPTLAGLSSSVLVSANKTRKPTGKFIQFVHIEGNHWITISNVHSKTPDQLTVYDSLHGGRLSTAAQQTIARYVKTTKDRLSIDLANVQQQDNSNDCGPFAIAFGVSLAYGEDPVQMTYTTTSLRQTLNDAFTNKFLERFSSTCQFRNADSVRTYDVEIHCRCRGIDDGTKMVKCERCSRWFHFKCCDIDEDNVKDWSCELCK
ncbi:putative SCAN domain-containing protein 3-like [Apostichopus japonicus]|uniref:Putative SCAN domain-containing protein 3-like n=1 Tax=Stichopus japonicus TaxID=307972 RepID=A0A2G8JVA9_STIJA|nr:putative SCAN domain-containing protein 3-like [Apostichopus japonicus]